MTTLARNALHQARYAPKRRSGGLFLPAPVGGWNAVDPQGMMKPEYAVSMINFFPMENGLVTRGGSDVWCAMDSPVETLMEYKGGVARFAVSGGTIYTLPATQGGKPTATPVTGLTNSQMQHVQIGTPGGNFLWCCNGADAPRYYDGTEWKTAELTSTETGFSGTAIVNCCVYQNRLFLCAKDSLTLWYLGTQAIQGEAKPLFMGSYLTRGGYLMACANMPVDGGDGPDDYLVVVTSEGEALVFKGKNPDDATAWTMTGRFQFSRPLGYRCLQKFGGDLIVITEHGVAGVASMLSNELPGLKSSSTEKIQPLWADMTRGKSEAFGWQACIYHRRGLLFVNVVAGSLFGQLVLNLETHAWSKLQGWEGARCLLETAGEIWAGFGDSVRRLDVGFHDIGTSGEKTPVVGTVQQAFIFAGRKDRRKRYTLMRPYIICRNLPRLGAAIATDSVPVPRVVRQVMDFSGSPRTGATWNIAVWDVSEWGLREVDELKLRTRWVSLVGHGYSVSPVIEVSSQSGTVTYTGCDLQYEVGNAL